MSVVNLDRLREEQALTMTPITGMEAHNDEALVPAAEMDVMSSEELESIHRRTFSAQNKYQSEQLKKSIRKNQTLNLESIRPPSVAPELPADQIDRGEKLTRQQQKALKRQEDNMRKAKGEGYKAATPQTLAMLAECKKGENAYVKLHHRVQQPKKGDKQIRDYIMKTKDWRHIDLDGIFPDDLFTPSFDKKTSATINFVLIHEKCHYANTILTEMESEKRKGNLTPEEKEAMDRLIMMNSLVERHMNNILMANGTNVSHEKISEAQQQAGRAAMQETATEYHKLTREGMLRSLDRLTKTDEYAEAMRRTPVIDFTTSEDYRITIAALTSLGISAEGREYKVASDANKEYLRVAKFVQDRTQQINAIKAMSSISKEEKQRFEKFLGDAQFNAARLRMEMLLDAIQYITYRKNVRDLAPGVHIMLQDDFEYITAQRAMEIREEEQRAGNAGNA